MANWVEACGTDDIDEEDLVGWVHEGHHYAIYRSHKNEFFATDAHCTHEHELLTDGLVIDYIIECPRHNGRFDYRTGEAKAAPVCVNLQTYPVKCENDKILVQVRARILS